jgi:GNAT superfamily N-acetyltransferase
MAVAYRPARAGDLEEADRLVVAAINDLTERHGFGSIASPHPPNFQAFSLRDDARGLWVAEEDGAMLGFAWSWISADLWFLAQLFVAPGRQGGGIGNTLIARTLDQADASRAKTRALITFSFNAVSQGLYIRHGFLPRGPLYVVSTPRQRVLDRLSGPRLRAVPLDASALDALAQIDVSALGASREKHHRYLAEEGTLHGFALHAAEGCVGYVYVGADGHIGPLAVNAADVVRPAFAAALAIAADLAPAQVSAFVSGESADALAAAVACGMRIHIPFVLMSNRRFGDWSRYLPRNPGFM